MIVTYVPTKKSRELPRLSWACDQLKSTFDIELTLNREDHPFLSFGIFLRYLRTGGCCNAAVPSTVASRAATRRAPGRRCCCSIPEASIYYLYMYFAKQRAPDHAELVMRVPSLLLDDFCLGTDMS